MIYPWGIIGHNSQLEQLEREISGSHLTHAYLFYGPRDTGKFKTAATFASILLCPNNLCHECRDCSLIRTGGHPDLIQMVDDGQSIKIDDVRDLTHKTSLTSQGKRRIVLIENIERMPIEAQNSFLKTLEEPPGETIFLLTSTQVKKIVPTILSRVRQMAFSLVSDEIMRQELAARFRDNPNFEEVLELAQGRPGLAVTLLSDSANLAAYKAVFTQIELFLRNNDLVAKFSYAEELDEDPKKLELFFDSFCFVLRKACYDFLKGAEHSLRGRYDLERIADLFEYLLKTRYLIERNANKKLSLENFFLKTEIV